MKYTTFGRRIIAFLLVLIASSKVHALDENTLTIFVDNSYPPYMYELEETKAEGLYPRLLREVVRRAGHKIEVKAYPWKRALSYGAAGKGAVGGAYKNDERMQSYDYSQPLYQEKLVIFVNKDNQFEFNDVEDLKDKVIGVNRGWSYGQKFDSARENELFKVSIRNTPSENFEMLALGRIDCLILDQLSGASYMRLMEIEDKVVALPKAFSVNNGYLIISKPLQKASFLNQFDAALEKMREDGSYNNIVNRFVQGTIAPVSAAKD